MLRNRLLAATAVFALASGTGVVAGPGSALPSPLIQTAPANDNSSTAANTAFVGSAVSTAIANLKTYFGSLLQQNYTLQVPSATALRALVGFPGVTVHRSGFYTPGDGGAADYAFSRTACAADDGGTCLAANGGGSWDIDANLPISVLTFGAKCDGITSDASAVQAAMNASAAQGFTLHLPRTRTCLAQQLLYSTGLSFEIEGTLLGSGDPNTNMFINAPLVGSATSADHVNILAGV